MVLSTSQKPILLFDDECGVCRHIARWVTTLSRDKSGIMPIDVRGIGNDPQALRSLNPQLNIWDAYATIHVLMPDGSMKLGGEAVAEVLRRLPGVRRFTWTLGLSLFGFRPFQTALNVAYAILADIRPLFGCESCGVPSPWVRPFLWMSKRVQAVFRTRAPLKQLPHFTPRRNAVAAKA